MQTLDKITVKWQQNGTATCLARVCARDATGAATGISGEGNWIKQADLASITCKVFDRSSATPDTPIATPSIVISAAILNVPDESGLIWDIDDTGYNFLVDLAGSCFPAGADKYLAEFLFTTTGGSTWCLAYEGVASPVIGS